MKAPYKAIEYIIENSCKYAEAKAQRIYLEEFRKTKKALLMKDAMARGIDSAVAQERAVQRSSVRFEGKAEAFD